MLSLSCHWPDVDVVAGFRKRQSRCEVSFRSSESMQIRVRVGRRDGVGAGKAKEICQSTARGNDLVRGVAIRVVDLIKRVYVRLLTGDDM